MDEDERSTKEGQEGAWTQGGQEWKGGGRGGGEKRTEKRKPSWKVVPLTALNTLLLASISHRPLSSQNKRVWDVTTEVAKYVELEGGGRERVYMEDNIETIVKR